MHHANHFYGHAHILARYAELAEVPRIWGYLQHGWNVVDGYAVGTKFAPGFPKFVWSDAPRRRGWAMGRRDYQVVGSPWAYLLLLEEQDRSQWDRSAIGEGTALVREALRGGRPGRFALQAAIAAVHARAPAYRDTDWRQILGLYDLLGRAWTSPVVALNRAVALAMAEGPEAGLAAIGDLERDGRLAGYQYLPAAKADLLRRLGRADEAAQAYRCALGFTANQPERDFLARRLAEVTCG